MHRPNDLAFVNRVCMVDLYTGVSGGMRTIKRVRIRAFNAGVERLACLDVPNCTFESPASTRSALMPVWNASARPSRTTSMSAASGALSKPLTWMLRGTSVGFATVAKGRCSKKAKKPRSATAATNASRSSRCGVNRQHMPAVRFCRRPRQSPQGFDAFHREGLA